MHLGFYHNRPQSSHKKSTDGGHSTPANNSNEKNYRVRLYSTPQSNSPHSQGIQRLFKLKQGSWDYVSSPETWGAVPGVDAGISPILVQGVKWRHKRFICLHVASCHRQCTATICLESQLIKVLVNSVSLSELSQLCSCLQHGGCLLILISWSLRGHQTHLEILTHLWTLEPSVLQCSKLLDLRCLNLRNGIIEFME